MPRVVLHSLVRRRLLPHVVMLTEVRMLQNLRKSQPALREELETLVGKVGDKLVLSDSCEQILQISALLRDVEVAEHFVGERRIHRQKFQLSR